MVNFPLGRPVSDIIYSATDAVTAKGFCSSGMAEHV